MKLKQVHRKYKKENCVKIRLKKTNKTIDEQLLLEKIIQWKCAICFVLFLFVSLTGFCCVLIVFFRVTLGVQNTDMDNTGQCVAKKKKTPNNPPPPKKTPWLPSFVLEHWSGCTIFIITCVGASFSLYPGFIFIDIDLKRKKEEEEASLLVFIQYAHKYHTFYKKKKKMKNVFFSSFHTRLTVLCISFTLALHRLGYLGLVIRKSQMWFLSFEEQIR